MQRIESGLKGKRIEGNFVSYKPHRIGNVNLFGLLLNQSQEDGNILLNRKVEIKI